MDFADPQGGKGASDRKAGCIKSHMKFYLNAGHNIESSSDMKKAILSSGGVPAVNVTLSEPPQSKSLKNKIDDISFISNVKYVDDSLRV